MATFSKVKLLPTTNSTFYYMVYTKDSRLDKQCESLKEAEDYIESLGIMFESCYKVIRTQYRKL